ncbi:MAG: DUF4157 domain-containing protein, partial [Bacteroidota bacterium]
MSKKRLSRATSLPESSRLDAPTQAKSMAPPTFDLNASSSAPIQGKFSDFVKEQGQESKSASSGSQVSMSESVQAKMEGTLGADFSGVQMYKDSEKAQGIGAQAYAQGNEVHFAPGQFKEDTAGQELIGHELAHVVQQREGRVSANTSVGGMPVNDSSALENEADAKGAQAARASDVAQAKVEGADAAAENVLQASFISFALKAGAKNGSKAMLKNFIKTKIRGRISKVSVKRLKSKFTQEADTLTDILTDSWWEVGIGLIPIVGDAFDLYNVPKKIAKAIKAADNLEDRVKKFRKRHV